MPRRSELDVLHAMLHSIERGYNSKSSLMKNAGLGAKQLQEYLKYTLEKDMVNEKDGRLVLTEKGKKVLDELEKISKLQAEIAMRLSALQEIIEGEGKSEFWEHQQ